MFLAKCFTILVFMLGSCLQCLGCVSKPRFTFVDGYGNRLAWAAGGIVEVEAVDYIVQYREEPTSLELPCGHITISIAAPGFAPYKQRFIFGPSTKLVLLGLRLGHLGGKGFNEVSQPLPASMKNCEGATVRGIPLFLSEGFLEMGEIRNGELHFGDLPGGKYVFHFFEKPQGCAETLVSGRVTAGSISFETL